MAAMVPFAWDDPFNLDDQLTEDERMIRDAAHAFAQGELQPRVIENFSKEVDDPELFPMMGEAGLRVGNLDCTLIAQAPRLAPYQAAMEKNLARLLAVPGDRVNLKLKSNDGMGALGREEGMAALAVVLLEAGTE